VSCDPASLDKYQTYFCDSITALSRLCFNWAKSQPAAFSDRTSKPDSRGAYGLLGQEMVTALTHLQHARGKNVVFVAILDSKTDARCLCRDRGQCHRIATPGHHGRGGYQSTWDMAKGKAWFDPSR